MHKLQITFITILPDMFPGPLAFSLMGKALQEGLWSYNIVDIKDFGLSIHKKVDDKPCGGGHGMVMRPDVLGVAIDFSLQQHGPFDKIFYMSPRGVLLKQDMALEIIGQTNQVKKIAILCGRFEGVDQRVIKYYNIEEISIGDFVISGGELAAMTFVDCLVRLLDGFAGSKESIFEDSFSGSLQGLLEYPLYTKPVNWQGLIVPDVLLSGNHASINAWKLENAKSTTRSRRPDLWQLYADKSK